MQHTHKHFLTLVCLTSFIFISGCATEGAKNPQDPYEGFNRKIYSFNRTVDKYVFKPVSQVYDAVLPNRARKSVTNFFNNIDTVPTIANDVLQFKLFQAWSDTWRLAVNTTIGIGGLFDVATSMGLERHQEDLGLTFARWGYKESAFLELPILGPHTIRDAIARPINYSLLTIYPHINDVRWRNGLLILNAVNRRAELLDLEKIVEEAALDRYAFERDAYLQNRKFLMSQDKAHEDEFDPYVEE